MDCVEVSDVRHTFYNVNAIFDLFTNIIVGDIIKKKNVKDINLYTKKLHSKYIVLFF